MNPALRGGIVLAALVAGFGTGAWIQGLRGGAVPGGEARPAAAGERRAPAPGARAADPPAPGVKPSAPGVPVTPAATEPSVAELAARAAELLAEARERQAAGDGRGMLRLMRRLALLGEPGYEGALELYTVLLQDSRADPPRLGVSASLFFRAAFSPDMGPLSLWILQNPGRASAAVRAQAVLAAAWSPDLDCRADLLAYLKVEQDQLAAFRALGGLGRISADELPALSEALRHQASNPEIADRILSKMCGVGGDAAWAAIEPFGASSDPEIAARAQVRLRQLRPPAAGALVVGLPAGTSDCALQRGDIVLSWDGKQVENEDQLQGCIDSKEPGKRAIVVVHRGDGLVTVEVEALPKWVQSRTVVPGK